MWKYGENMKQYEEISENMKKYGENMRKYLEDFWKRVRKMHK